jgi:hypothetical protein
VQLTGTARPTPELLKQIGEQFNDVMFHNPPEVDTIHVLMPEDEDEQPVHADLQQIGINVYIPFYNPAGKASGVTAPGFKRKQNKGAKSPKELLRTTKPVSIERKEMGLLRLAVTAFFGTTGKQAPPVVRIADAKYQRMRNMDKITPGFVRIYQFGACKVMKYVVLEDTDNFARRHLFYAVKKIQPFKDVTGELYALMDTMQCPPRL